MFRPCVAVLLIIEVVLVSSRGAGAAEGEQAAPAPLGEAAVPSEPASPTRDDQETTAQWERKFEKARVLMRDGFFTAAAAAFTALADAATSAARKRAALEASWLCTYWARRGYTLQLTPPDGSRPHMADRRSTEELAVLYTSAFFYGLGSGLALAALSEPDSVAAGVLPMLGLAGLSTVAVYSYDKGAGLRYGAAQSITSGLYIGLEEGLAWVLWYQSRATWEDELSARAVAGLLWGTSTVGVLLGGLVGQTSGITPGRASLMGSGAFWSAIVLGFGTYGVSGDESSGLLSAAIALNVGTLAALGLGRGAQPSLARVRFIDLGGLAGGLTTAGLLWAIAGEGTASRSLSSALSVGSGLGLLSAWYLTREMEPDHPRRDDDDVAMMPAFMPSADGRGGLLGVAGMF